MVHPLIACTWISISRLLIVPLNWRIPSLNWRIRNAIIKYQNACHFVFTDCCNILANVVHFEIKCKWNTSQDLQFNWFQKLHTNGVGMDGSQGEHDAEWHTVKSFLALLVELWDTHQSHWLKRRYKNRAANVVRTPNVKPALKMQQDLQEQLQGLWAARAASPLKSGEPEIQVALLWRIYQRRG